MPNRLVIVDDSGLVYDETGVDIQITFQDDGKTLKLFVKPSENAAEEKAEHVRAFTNDIKSIKDFAHDIEECPWPH